MAIAASESLAQMAEEKGLTPDYILPTMDEWDVFPREAAAVAMKAQEQGVAQRSTTYEEEYERAQEMIRISREMTQLLMREGFIPAAPEDDDA